jgi:hypothetical protein
MPAVMLQPLLEVEERVQDGAKIVVIVATEDDTNCSSFSKNCLLFLNSS